MSASPKRKCPKCGKMSLKRLIGTGSAVIFKGSGFYQTDYRSESYKKAAKAEASSGQAKTSSDTKKESTSKPASESKPVKVAAD
jgi:predicted nucleic acid-binding Zn ribbon protein